jgi:hypothetical protein
LSKFLRFRAPPDWLNDPVTPRANRSAKRKTGHGGYRGVFIWMATNGYTGYAPALSKVRRAAVVRSMPMAGCTLAVVSGFAV